MQRAFMLMIGLLSLLMVGCTLPVAPVSPGEAAVTVRLDRGGYQLQALVGAWTAADIDHVKLLVYRGGTLVPGATASVPRAALSAPVTLKNLRMATSYEIRAAAYRDAAATQVISDPATSSARFTTPARYQVSGVETISLAPTAVSLPLRLLDQSYSGQGSYTLSVGPNFNGRNTLSQVRVRLMRVGAAGAETPVGTRTFAPTEINASQAFSLANLKMGMVYKLYADGFASDGMLISDPLKSQVLFSTAILTGGLVEDTIPLQVLPLSS